MLLLRLLIERKVVKKLVSNFSLACDWNVECTNIDLIISSSSAYCFIGSPASFLTVLGVSTVVVAGRLAGSDNFEE